MTDYRPKELKVEVNRNCPLHCLHCSSNGTSFAVDQLHPDRLVRLLDEFSFMGGEEVAISGGEPLFYSDLPYVLQACNNHNLKTTLYTTGIELNSGSIGPVSQKMLSLLAECDVKMIFSVLGSRKETHDSITRVVGSFQTTITAMKRALRDGIEVEVHTVPTALNFNEISDIADMLNDLKLRKMSLLRFVPQGRGAINREKLELTTVQLAQLGELVIQLREIYPKLEIRTGAPFNILGLKNATPCKAAISEITIRPDGQIAPCDAFKRFDVEDDFSNIKQHSLAEVWERSAFLNEIRQLHKLDVSASCAKCPYYDMCGSGCPAQKAIVSGMIGNGRDPNCLLSQLEVRSCAIEAGAIC